MKCPKCRYIGFETGDRCRNCGYDFSLLSDDALVVRAGPGAGRSARCLDLHSATRRPSRAALADGLVAAAAGHRAWRTRRHRPALPLFRDDHEAEDEPLVRMAAPRPPIAVRKTPDAQRLRFPRP